MNAAYGTSTVTFGGRTYTTLANDEAIQTLEPGNGKASFDGGPITVQMHVDDFDRAAFYAMWFGWGKEKRPDSRAIVRGLMDRAEIRSCFAHRVPAPVVHGDRSVVINSGRQFGKRTRMEAWAAEMRKRGLNITIAPLRTGV
ncbi:hypothetical protein [Burkholderia sp. Ac-20349]|uniref:hypothetical protein n=1 Tax=Burkholderia sp. Ac-20349 TaxID=2703893 RepID=UPI00197C0901|nr:hypothetical protein [Burkholderia sp. Ac-20349]MBN3839316.1 hypothetical protein [Burkholderia sp. Ac-20349]